MDIYLGSIEQTDNEESSGLSLHSRPPKESESSATESAPGGDFSELEKRPPQKKADRKGCVWGRMGKKQERQVNCCDPRFVVCPSR